MDRESVDAIRFVNKKSPWGSIDNYLSRSIEKLSSLIKTVFQREEKYRSECNQASYSNIDLNNILSSQKYLSTRKCKAFMIQNTHKNKSRQFNEYSLTHVFLVMAKSQCTCTCIKSSKEFVCFV